MVQEVKDAIQVLRYIKSLKGEYRGFAEHTNSKDIHIKSTPTHYKKEANTNIFDSHSK